MRQELAGNVKDLESAFVGLLRRKRERALIALCKNVETEIIEHLGEGWLAEYLQLRGRSVQK